MNRPHFTHEKTTALIHKVATKRPGNDGFRCKYKEIHFVLLIKKPLKQTLQGTTKRNILAALAINSHLQINKIFE